MKNIDAWVRSLKERELPVLRRSIDEVRKLARRSETISAGEIAAVILHDPLLTLKVLLLANNMPRGRLGHEITTIEQAIIMMGIAPLFHGLANLTAVESTLPDPALQGLLRVMSRAHHAAWQGRDLAVLRADLRAEEVHIGSFLYDMGELLLWCLAPQEAMQIDRRARHGQSLEDAQQEVLGFALRDLQLALASAWNLPETLRDFMDSTNAVHSRTRVVVMAATMARRAARGWFNEELLADYEVIASLLRIPVDEVIPMLHRNAVAEARQWEWYGVPPAAAWLPMQPGEWPMEKDGAGEPEIPVAGTGLRQDELEKIIAEIAAHLDETLDLHGMMALVLRGMREGIGLQRVLFALLTTDRAMLKAKYIVGGQNSPLKQFQFSMEAPHLFSRLMGKVQSIWLNDGNRHAINPLLSTPIREVIGGGDFFAMSIFVHNTPVGLFFADHGPEQRTLDESSYAAFKRLCLRAAEGLAHLARK